MNDNIASWVLIGLIYGVVLAVFLSVKLDSQQRHHHDHWEHGCANHMVEESLTSLTARVSSLYLGTYITSPGCLYRLQMSCNDGRMTVITTQGRVYQLSFSLGMFDYLRLFDYENFVKIIINRVDIRMQENTLFAEPTYVGGKATVLLCSTVELIRMDMSDDGGLRFCCYDGTIAERVRPDLKGCPVTDERIVRLWQNGHEIQLTMQMRQLLSQPITTNLTPCTDTWCICSACKITDLGAIDPQTFNVSDEALLLPGGYVKYGATVNYFCSSDLKGGGWIERKRRTCQRLIDDINSLGEWVPLEPAC